MISIYFFNFPSEFNVHPGMRATGIKCLGKFHGKWSKEASIKFCLLGTCISFLSKKKVIKGIKNDIPLGKVPLPQPEDP